MTKEEYGLIEVREERDEHGRRIKTYRWEGPPLVRVSRYFLNEFDMVGDYVEIGPYLVRVVEKPWYGDYVIAVNVDDWRAAWYAFKFKVRAAWRELEWRSTYILIMLGLAKWPEPGTIVGWHLVKEKWL